MPQANHIPLDANAAITAQITRISEQLEALNSSNSGDGPPASVAAGTLWHEDSEFVLWWHDSSQFVKATEYRAKFVLDSDSPYTVLPQTYLHICDASAGGVRNIIPDAHAAITGQRYLFVKSDASANVVTIESGGGGALFNGDALLALWRQWDWAIVQSNGVNWVVLASRAESLAHDMATGTTSGTTQETVKTFAVPADFLDDRGAAAKGVEIMAVVETAGNGNDKRIVLSFGGTPILDTGAQAFNGERFAVQARVMRVGDNAQLSVATLLGATLTGTAVDSPAEDSSAAIDIDLDLETPDQAGDATVLMFSVRPIW